MNSSVSSATRAKVTLLVLFGLLHVFATAYLVVPGCLSGDESIYLWSAKEFATRWSLDIRNGYEEYHSAELVHPFLRVHDGKLYTQYPAVFPILAFPLYKLVGYGSLFLLNSLAFLVVMILCFATARSLLGDLDLALNSLLILCFATFAWEYSQAAWPHMVSSCFILGAFYAFVRSFMATGRRQQMLWALVSGIIAGFAPGIRNDGICVFPVITLAFVCTRPLRLRELAMVLAGMLPGICILSWINFLKYGIASPFADGNVSLSVGAMLAGGALCLCIPALFTRSMVVDKALKRKKVVWSMGVAAVLLMFLIEPVRRFVWELCFNSFVSTIDIRFFPDVQRPGMERGPLGAVIYFHSLKKALLQSLPFLVVLVLPLERAFRKGTDSTALRLLWVLPFTIVGFYAFTWQRYDSYEGGKCANLRYFVAILPFLSILCAHALRDLRERWSMRMYLLDSVVIGLMVLTFFVFPLLVPFPGKGDLTDALLLLIFPLVIASLLLVFLLLGQLRHLPGLLHVRRIFFIFLAATFTWAGLVAFLYDYPAHTRVRWGNFILSEQVRSVVADRSLVFTHKIEPGMRLIEDDTILAFPQEDKLEDFPALLDFHMQKGRRAYVLFPDDLWRLVLEDLLTRSGYDLVIRGSGKDTFLGEIILTSGK